MDLKDEQWAPSLPRHLPSPSVGPTKRGKGSELMAVADGHGLPLAIGVATAAPAEVKPICSTLVWGMWNARTISRRISSRRQVAILLAASLALVRPAAGAAPPAPGATRITITFVVQAPASTPPADTLRISGNLPELGPWDPGKVALQPLGAHTHSVTLELPAGWALEYKLTRGSWETVEKGSAGEEIANRRLVAVHADTVHVQVAQWRDQVERRAATRPATFTGEVRYLGRIRSAALGNERDVWVYLPPSYQRLPQHRYPVVYLHDGQNVLNAASAFIGVEWGADETLERLIAAGEMRAAIAVAIANTPQRVGEYTQVADAGSATAPRADLYLKFLLEELKPHIDSLFRTLPGRDQTAMVGSSLGGLVSLYAGVVAGETFGLVAGVSPVVQWGDHDLQRQYEAAATQHLPLRIWIDMGTAEDPADTGSPPRLVGELRRFRDVLLARGYIAGQNLGYLEAPGAAHNEHAWAARLPDILRFLLPPEPGDAGSRR